MIHRTLDVNAHGNDWVVGDLHGCFGHLALAIEALGIRPGRDRLISVGDLVDRGPQSHEAIEWLDDGRLTTAVLGNHEQLMSLALTVRALERMWKDNGGGWWFTRSRTADERARWKATLDGLPITLTVRTPHGEVGVIHAQPVAPTWADTIRSCARDDGEGHRLRDRALWSRLRYGKVQEWLGETREDYHGSCRDVRAVLTGHSAHSHVRVHGNLVNLDTGACFDELDNPRLSFARIDTTPISVVSVSRTGEVRHEHTLAEPRSRNDAPGR